MPRLYKKVKKVALPPGTLRKIKTSRKTKIHIIDYSRDDFQEKELSSIEETFSFRDSQSITWINIDGRDYEMIKKIDDHFGIHPLVLEDIINAGQRPKIEDYKDYLFFVLKMIYVDESIDDIFAEQIGVVLGKNYVISFQEKQGDVFDPIRQRIRDGKGRIRNMGADYLAYALLDAIVDHYFIVLESIGEEVDDLEECLHKTLKRSTPMDIHKLKKQIIFLRKNIWPLREVIASFQRNESKLIKKETGLFIRDVYDHTIQVNDTVEAFRDALSGLHDIYLSTLSNQMNEVMKVLTIFAAIFIPLTFIAGIYGMNFQYMPELQWRNGYFYILGVMATVGFGMVAYFKKRNWL